MMKKTAYALICTLFFVLVAGCSKETPVSFSQDIHPILKENCFPCHQVGGMGEVASGLSVESYESLMRGTNNGPVIQPGQSYASTLQVLVEHKAGEEISMPRGGAKLAQEKIETIGKWIDQGAKNN